MDRCRRRLQHGTYQDLPEALPTYLVERLTQDAAERHIHAGIRASQQFQALLDRRLTPPDRVRRKVATVPTGELIDRYGRLLAYLAPWFSGSASDPTATPRRSPAADLQPEHGRGRLGGAVSHLPVTAAKQRPEPAARRGPGGLGWSPRRLGRVRRDLVVGYEYRACIKLGAQQLDDPAAAIAEAYQRHCMDLRDLRLVGRFDYFQVPPSQRLWIWEDDLPQARQDLDLPT